MEEFPSAKNFANLQALKYVYVSMQCKDWFFQDSVHVHDPRCMCIIVYFIVCDYLVAKFLYANYQLWDEHRQEGSQNGFMDKRIGYMIVQG